MSGFRFALVDDGQFSQSETAEFISRAAGANQPDVLIVPVRGGWFHTVREIRAADSDGRTSLLAFRGRWLARPAYWRLLSAFLVGAGVRGQLVASDGEFLAPAALLRFMPFLAPLYSLVIIVASPLYLFRQLLPNVLLVRETKDDPITGFGGDRSVNGLIYWLTLAIKARRYGVLGLAADVNFGFPLGVHSWPVSVWLLRQAGYRRFVALSVVLLVSGFLYVGLSSGHIHALVIVPLLLISTYAIFNLFVGTWEMLAWGLAVVAMAAFDTPGPIAPIVTGAAGALLVAAHPGVALLTAATLGIEALGNSTQLIRGALAAIVAFLGSLWFTLPHWRARAKLGRGTIINRYYKDQLRWIPSSVYQAFVYVVFLVIAAGHAPNLPDLLVLLLPLMLLYVNVRMRWIFSQYTLTNFMAVLGALFLLRNPGWGLGAAFLVMIFTPPMLLFGGAREAVAGFDVTPLRLGDTRRRVVELLGNLEGGRLAFESGGLGDDAAYKVATLAYALSDQPVHLLNGGVTEVGDVAVYERLIAVLEEDISPAELDRVRLEGGVRYLVAFTPGFARSLEAAGWLRKGEASGLALSPNLRQEASTIALYEAPAGTSLLAPPEDAAVTANTVAWHARAGARYRVALTAHLGWRATLDGEGIEIGDDNPGIAVLAGKEGDIRLRYRHRHYFMRAVRAS